MAVHKEIPELDLLEFSRCLLRQPQVVEYNEPLEVQAAKAALKKVLLSNFRTRQVPAEQHLRDAVDKEWRALAEKNEASDELMARGRVSLTPVFRRIYDLLTGYYIYQPVSHYTLNLGRASIVGEFAVVVPSRGRVVTDKILLLRLRTKGDHSGKSCARRPDVLSEARWLFLRSFEPTVPEIKVLNFGLDFTDQWEARVRDERDIRASLIGLVEMALSTPGFPSPGSYCSSCLTQACSPIGEILHV